MQQRFGSCIFVNAAVLNSDSKEVLHCAVVTRHWSLENQNVQNKGSACGRHRFEDETAWHSGCSEGCGVQVTGTVPQPRVMDVTKAVEKAATASSVSPQKHWKHALRVWNLPEDFFPPKLARNKVKDVMRAMPTGNSATPVPAHRHTAVPWMYGQLGRRSLGFCHPLDVLFSTFFHQCHSLIVQWRIWKQRLSKNHQLLQTNITVLLKNCKLEYKTCSNKMEL